jgi:hypothetical protein
VNAGHWIVTLRVCGLVFVAVNAPAPVASTQDRTSYGAAFAAGAAANKANAARAALDARLIAAAG